ncbi:MAG: 2-amino-4-hydroxy-6-hydroxymethyldihydropteridine diphosphokinase [Thermomonas sp.]|uniref:2-amino-4-hydroxy-6- hydroxymethyldihydropteridine diphosphokinase n=1 Tax=Thermomonas sp. TaxID=1971895 RepID=UPI001EBA4AB4|nr:2-amino-4-hydroxy-6-hydroxymethyldihydropteridine diphosphokinase [Thermomonas sp.]MBV2209796.1 2-amino-4-hydroxy-6-hydroxymethyldihydropteridine diphosphokinase [Thermomonas sp.]
MTQLIDVCIGLGANIGQPIAAIQQAFDDLRALPLTTLVAASRLYRTPAWGRVDQPDFINAAALLRTQLRPMELLHHLLDIERKAGRTRDSEIASMRWGPRVLDLDLLLYGDRKLNEPGLRVPHPHLHERAFALVPLAEIAPNAAFPGYGSVAEALRLIDASGVEAVHLER